VWLVLIAVSLRFVACCYDSGADFYLSNVENLGFMIYLAGSDSPIAADLHRRERLGQKPRIDLIGAG
jgi:hypothetical protein